MGVDSNLECHVDELNEVGTYFKSMEFNGCTEPIPFGVFEKLGWDRDTYITYLNQVDNVRSVFVLSRTSYLKSLSRNDQSDIFLSACKSFADFLKEHTGINLDHELLVRMFQLIDVSYYRDIYRRFPMYDLDEIEDEIANNPQVFLHMSLNEFRRLLETFIGRAANQKQQVTIISSDAEKEKFKLQHSSRISIKEALEKKHHELWEIERHPFKDTVDFNSITSLWDSAKKIGDRAFRAEELLDSIGVLEELLTEWDEEPWFSSKTGILYVHRGMIKCLRDKHTVTSVTAVIPGRSGLPVELNVNYCVDCDKFFIDEKEFEHYRKKYGLLVAHFVFETDDGSCSPYRELAEQSLLKLCGYSVSASDGFSAEERTGLLAAIIDNGVMSKSDVLNYLHWFVQYNGNKPGNEIAVEKWKSDISFVRDYHIGDQAHCYISDIKQWGK